jgi:hypothetical protein
MRAATWAELARLAGTLLRLSGLRAH